jgi:hypothetical protein
VRQPAELPYAWCEPRKARASLVTALKAGYQSNALNFIRANRSLSTTLVLTMLLAWMALSQRCAMGQMLFKAKQAAAVQHACCEKSNPKPVDGGRAECCQALSVLVPDGVKLPATASEDYLPVPCEWILAALESLAAGGSFAPDTGPPPDQLSFVELVLHRSLRAHAPPVLT